MYQQDFELDEDDEDDNDIGSARAAATRTGDFVPMQSGSPAFGFWSNGPYAVAVCSGQGDSGPENWFSAGSDLVELVEDRARSRPVAIAARRNNRARKDSNRPITSTWSHGRRLLLYSEPGEL